MELDQFAADIPIRLAKIRLGMARPVDQRHEHLARSKCRGGHVLAYNRVAAGIALLGP
jgi:hypothetical protein